MTTLRHLIPGDGGLPYQHAAALCILGLIAYYNSFNMSFAYDDYQNIIDCKYIKDFKYFKLSFVSGDTYGFRSRYIGYLTFAVNYWMHGLSVQGYHIVNTIIHICNSLIIYKIILLLADTRLYSDYTDRKALQEMAFFASALFVVHPIQTQSVTYIVQRFELLSTMFYLLAIIFYIKARKVPSVWRYFYYITSLLSAFLAMKTKEISFTIPITAIVVEYLFIEGKKKYRFVVLLPMLLLLLIIPLTLVGGDISKIFNAHKIASESTSHYHYAITQFAIILTYIRLLVFPVNQILDYDYPLYSSIFEAKAAFGLVVVVSIMTIAVYSFYRARRTDGRERYYLRLLTFGTVWFFITLSVQSGLVPLKDLLVEHRLYLPSIGFFMALLSVIEIDRICRGTKTLFPVKQTRVVLVIMLLVLCIATLNRNMVWRHPIVLWEDVVKKSPGKARGWYNLGTEYLKAGRTDDAILEFKKALVILPVLPEAIHNIGMSFMSKGMFDEAKAWFKKNIDTTGYVDSYVAYGNVLLQERRFDEARKKYDQVIGMNPMLPEAYNGLGAVMALTGDPKGSISMFKKALELKPEYKEAADNMQAALSMLGSPVAH